MQIADQEKVVTAAKSLHAGYENEYFVRGPDLVRGVLIFTVPFRYQDGKQFGEVFVVQRGKTLRAHHTIKEVMAALGEKEVFWRDRNLIALYVMCFVAGALLAAVLWLCVKQPENQTLEKLISLLTLAIGYVVGNQVGGSGRGKSEAE
ncbi:hypothetical protein [Rhizobium ruizarguesonis]|uniref:hypothetical protein n=1 Tax=Rhizobium ruizarguesonis TaxID=2081791 RepID=UPI00102FE0BE|nr:hypothetical protein [Rhizobium ruizarguesonis]TBA72904.1 hypothetical protein ELH56_35190 [Rhizobium ruizarguesonis]WSH62383.1 hypothetical protein U8P68_38005 [Rhizobium ruizarguesonis]